jgi:hypothetical protein
VCPGLAHRTVRCTTGQCPVHQGESAQTPQLRVSQAQLRYNLPVCPVHQRSNDYLRATVDSDGWTVQHSTTTEVRAAGQRGTRLSGVTPDCLVPHEDKASNGRPAPSPNGKMTWRCTGHCPAAHRTVRCVHRQQPSPTATIWLVVINTTPTGHFKVGEPKQHSKSYSWHTQALPTTSIHWSILYTRFRPLQTTQVPQKREQAKESLSCEFSSSALWDSLRESVCYILRSYCAWSFDSHWTSSKVLEACKASKRHLSVWWSLRGLKWSLRRRRARRSWGSVERGKGLKETRP